MDESATQVQEQGGGPENRAEAPLTVEEAQREIELLRDKNLRLMADMRNAQQRSQREREEAIRYAEADFARDLLVVLDDLDRAIQSASGGDPALSEGVRIVQEQFQKVLRNHGITPIEAEGREFDPQWHEALMQQPHASRPAGTVSQELARGYRMHERVLRPSRVIVSTGAGGAGGSGS
jgi:molecular chaperone GrpE